MPIMCVFRVPNATPADYDNVRRAVRWEEKPPQGGIAHFISFTDEGAVEFDVWESREAFARFAKERWEPALKDLDIDMGEPEIHDLGGMAMAEDVSAYQVPRMAPALRRAAAPVLHETDARA